MMLTTKGRYAVAAIIEIALRDSSEPVTLAEIAQKQEIPRTYLEQIFLKLKNAGLVEAVKGPGGGYFISLDLRTLTVANIIDAVEENIEMTKCKQSLIGCATNGKKCLTHDLWGGLSKNIREYLSKITIADIVANQ